ncbi:MAG: GAF domain-containing sensor histidine kinase [Longimicrobiaceae bacterium]
MNTELSTLTALAQALGRSADLAESLDAALATVADVLGLETGWVWLLEEGDPEPRLAAARALPPALRDHPRAMRGDCYCLSTFRAGDLRGAANVNVVWCSRLEKVVEGGDGNLGLRCHASVPLAVGSRQLGMLNVAAPDWRVLTEQELNLLTTAGALVSLALERQRLEAVSARAAAAEERNLLAREIHDTLAQGLAALTLQLEVADSLAAAGGDARMSAVVGRSLALARATLEEARRSVLDLRAAPLGGLTLPGALRELAASVRHEQDAPEIEVEVEGFHDEEGPLPPAVEAGVYRIAQQALANASHHARARRVVLRLSRTPDALELGLRDDGVGFDVAAVPPGRFGLVGMSERARLLGGTLAVESSPGAGTLVHVHVPLRPQEDGDG